MKKVYLFMLLQFVVLTCIAQFSISGIVRNTNNENLIGANIIISNSFIGANTDVYGEFALSKLNSGNYELQISYLGYETNYINLFLISDTSVLIVLVPAKYLTDDVIVEASRAGRNSPIAYTNISSNEIEKSNLAQDIPYLLNLSPSTVVSSDAGAGIGYSSISIRGSDANRINVTVDGIPINDPESHSVYWVNMPDIASSTENIQIQRGVGTSSNGAGAFGASINFLSEPSKKEAYAILNTTIGSFSLLKNNVKVGTGLINDKFSVDTRLSRIASNGFIDRASSNLQSFQLSGQYKTDVTIVKAKMLIGKEKTYQAWNGIPKVRLENDTEGMQRYLDHWLYSEQEYNNMINSDSRTYNIYTYNNQTDNYNQNHFYLLFSHQFTEHVLANINFHYTKGKGYYESFKNSKKFSDYNLQNVVIGGDTLIRTNLIQQKWLDNDFYGLTFSVKYNKKKTNFIVGGAANQYKGLHFGNIIWAQYSSNSNNDYKWYENIGIKTDLNIYSRVNYQITKKINLFGDVQLRYIDYSVDGIHDDLRDISMTKDYNFFNPKVGISYEPSSRFKSFASISVAHKEPSRRNYVDAINGNITSPEKLIDYELGGRFMTKKVQLSANFYYMDYKDQLVLTGQINNVGDAILTNVDKSYRMGVEFSSAIILTKKLIWQTNVTFSRNKIRDFVEYVDNWDTWKQDATIMGETDLAFSPSINIMSLISYSPINNLSIDFVGKFIGRQYIDNTSNIDRSLDPYFINNINFSYKIKNIIFNEIDFKFMINNIFNVEYETNAWVYQYNYGGKRYAMDGYFPQAGTSFIAGLTIVI